MSTRTPTSKSNKNKSNKSAASAAKAEVGASATEAVEQVQDSVSGLKDSVKEQASNQMTIRLDAAAGGLDMAVKLLRSASDQVREQEKTGVADSITSVADRLEGWSGSIRDQDVDKIVQESKQFAQRKPALFVAGATALGFLGARFLTMSAAKEQEATPEQGSSQGSDATSSTSSAVGTDFPNTSPYTSVEENAALEASVEAPGGEDVILVDDMTLESDIVLDDADVLLDDTTFGTDVPASPLDRSGTRKRPEGL